MRGLVYTISTTTGLQDMPKLKLFSPRGRRGLGWIVIAVIVIVAAGLVYVHRNLSPKPKTASPTISLPPVSRQSDVVSYDFLTPSIGWALVVTVTLTNGPGQFSVFRTTDSAKHWQKQFTGQNNSIGLGPQSVQFFDRSNGFVVVASVPDLVYRTTDGGAQWHPIGLPGRSGVVTFSDPRHGWLLVSNGSPSLYSSGDGGSTWQSLPDPPPHLAAAIAFRQPSEGWTGGSDEPGDPVPHVYSSSDGGHSWQRHNLPIPSEGLPASGVFASVQLLPRAGVAAVLNEGNRPAFTASSFDGGITWTYAVPRPSGLTSGGVISYQDSFRWWAIDGHTLYKSSDAGQTWMEVSNNLDGGYVYVPRVIDSKHAWAQVLGTGGAGLALTADGGLHWTRANVPQLA